MFVLIKGIYNYYFRVFILKNITKYVSKNKYEIKYNNTVQTQKFNLKNTKK